VAHDSGSPVSRRPQDRLDDHAAIDRLADELLPALVAELGAKGLGELEVREGTWRVRLRMPADGHAAGGRRSTSGRGGARAADGPHGEQSRTDAAGTTGTTGSGNAAAGTAGSAGPGRGAATAASGDAPQATPATGPSRLVAVSPAVGFFRPRADLRAGTQVRAGDRIGSVDVLGIGQDLVAPGDGLIGATLVAAGEPVEYGQAVIVLEQPAEPTPEADTAPADSAPASPPDAPADAPARNSGHDDPPGDDGSSAAGVA